MKKIALILATALLTISCNNTEKEVILSYPDGNPKLIYYTQGNDDKKALVAEENLYENGQTRYRKDYKDGQPSGLWKFYYEDGKIFAEADFSKNEFGDNWHFYNPDGTTLAEAKDSIHIAEVSTDRSPITITVGANKYQKTEYQFYSNYTMRQRCGLNEGQRDGKCSAWFENGSLQSECSYVFGKAHGEQTVYYDNGKPRYKGSYNNGTRTGQWQFFDEDGNLLSTQNY